MDVTRFQEGFSLSLHGRELIRHTPKHPCIALGSAVDDVVSSSGHFSVKEHHRRRRLLREAEIINPDDKRVIISFEQGLCTLTVEEIEDSNALSLEFDVPNPRFNRFWFWMPADTHERIYGSGELFDRQNLRGSVRPLWISEPGVGRRADLFTLSVAAKTKHFPRWHHSNFAIPSRVSSEGRYFYSDCTCYGKLMFNKPHVHGYYSWAIPKQIIIGSVRTMKDAVSELSLILGRQPKLPEWVYDGIILGIQGGKDAVSNKINKSFDHDMQIAGVWCQDWQGIRMTSFGKQLRWCWQHDQNLYPKLSAFSAELKNKGIRFLGYINTFLTPGTPMYEEAREKGYLITDSSLQPYPVYVPFDPGMLLDFTNPDARAWIKEIIKKEMIEVGLSGWMADFGEYIPSDACMSSGESAMSYHNRYPADWAKINWEAAEESGKTDEIFFFMRAASLGSNPYLSSFWTGDQLVDFSKEDGLPSAINASLVLGISGIGYVHSDVGGYTTLGKKRRTRQLLLRWAEYAAFTPSMRTHEGNRPQNNVQFDDDLVIDGVARMSRIYAGLKPYHIHLSGEYQRTGIPPMRMLQMHYPDQIDVLEKWPYQYLYGEDLLVAPVIKEDRTDWDVYLPPGEWVHLWSRETFQGSRKIAIEAPLGHPPVFFASSSSWRSLFEALA
jgi:alpha-glucosidase